MPELTNREIVKIHLYEFIREYGDNTWYGVLSYCSGYYDKIDMDIIMAVRELQVEGVIAK